MKTNIDLTDFKTSKLSVDEAMNTKGGFGSATSGKNTNSGGSDTDCNRRDCDGDNETIAIE